ncbi:hypothetical protein AAG570_009656 [Ranatra chinensis]|uniref:Phospholysine phosphohistidine inorganic pyrophosphate phosphatase n=1 Tax=Ranatra chinensis TaxID=642074 RepID=A0ABD0YQB3_9HEMI
MSHTKLCSRPIKGLILDIAGVLKDGDIAIPGSVEAVAKLQAAGFPFRLVTNETLKTKKVITKTLNMLGFRTTEREMFSPIPAIVEILKKEKLRPHLLLHPNVLPEFKDLDMENPNCVVVGDAEECFTYETLNESFRKLMEMEDPKLFSLGIGKYYMDDDGLALDVGSFCKGLEYATGVKARIVGKPSSDYFLAAVDDLGLKPEEVVMVGDDIEFDVNGAQQCGMRGVLVRTGKFRKTDESHPRVMPDAIVDNLLHAIELVLNSVQNFKHKI